MKHDQSTNDTKLSNNDNFNHEMCTFVKDMIEQQTSLQLQYDKIQREFEEKTKVNDFNFKN